MDQDHYYTYNKIDRQTDNKYKKNCIPLNCKTIETSSFYVDKREWLVSDFSTSHK